MVIETVGPVADFLNAVEKIQGFEWLGEFEIEDNLPGHGFEDAKDPGKTLKGRLFLVMTDQRALKELRNLFDGWKKDPNKSFPRTDRGDVFYKLYKKLYHHFIKAP
jgi:hypothetical protein